MAGADDSERFAFLRAIHFAETAAAAPVRITV
jgi:hypothetical protein